MERLQVSIESHDCTPADYYEKKELSENINKALLKIETKYRALIILKHFQNCSYQEISKMINLPVKTVKSRLYIARQLLAKLLVNRGIT
jgi:RNA polymerase sigma-70 factor (ECF subfamily)